MSGESEVGHCEVCKFWSNGLSRKYYYYKVDCECCNGDTHFQFVRHCNNCIPKPPRRINATVKPLEL